MNIGSLNFTVDANTSGLRRAIARLKEYEKVTNKVAQSNKKGASSTANIMAKQEQAIRRAFQQLLNYQQVVERSSASEQKKTRLLHEANEAFQLMVRQLTDGTQKLHNFNRATDSFAGSLGRVKRELKETSKATEEGGSRWAKYTILMRNMESSAVLAMGPLSGLGSRIRSMSAILTRSSGKFSGWKLAGVGAIIAVSLGFGKLAAHAIAAGAQLKSLQLRFEAATGSFGMGNKRLHETIELAKLLGLEVNTLTTSYSRFLAASQGTSLEGEKARKIFEQVARAAAALKLESGQVEGIMRALEQMMSKGTIQAEELRGQLGDRLPGAFRIMAEALHVTTRELNKMLKAGDIIASEALPLFAQRLEEAVGKNAEKNVTTLSGAINVLKTEWFELGTSIDRGLHLSAVAVTMVNLLTSIVDNITIGDVAAAKAAMAFEDAAKSVTKYRITIQGLKIEVKDGEELTGRWEKLKIKINEAAKGLRTYGAALDFIQNAQGGNLEDPQFMLDYFTAIEKLGSTAMPKQDLQEAADLLELITGMDFIQPNLHGIASGFALMEQQIREANTAMELLIKGPAIIKELDQELVDLNIKIAMFKQGAEAFKIFEDATLPALVFGKALLEAGEQAEVAAIKQGLMEDALRRWIVLQDERKAADKATKAEQKAFDSMVKALVNAGNQLRKFQGELDALNSGPGGLRIFEGVTVHIDKMRAALLGAKIDINVVNNTLEVFERILRDIVAVNVAAEMSTLAAELEDVLATTAAMAEGKDALEIWKEVTKPAQDYGAAVLAVAQNTEDATAAQLAMNAALLEQLAIQREITADEKARKDEERRIKRAAKALQDFVFMMGQLQLKLGAMAQGPESLEIFEKIEAPIAAATQKLLEMGWQIDVINVFMRQYEELLRQQFAMTDKWARANQRMADAIVNGLENVILAGESVRDMLHDLANELLRVALRAMFLDKLKNSLFQLFQGGMFPSMIGNSAGATAPIVTPSKGFSHGGSFKLTGSGGADNIPFFGMGKAGETVSVTRADQGGRGGNVYVEQNNYFEGNFGDPETMIPMLEENNRKLEASIIMKMARGDI